MLKKKTIFFALWPDQQTRQKINRIMSEIDFGVKARITAKRNLHLTLHFIGNVDAASLNCYRLNAANVQMENIRLKLDLISNFTKPEIAWLGPSKIPRELYNLHLQLAKSLKICGFKAETRKFTPHITLARKVANFNLRKITPINWKVSKITLIESRPATDGVIYQPLQNWPV